jgi:hypothetical protein
VMQTDRRSELACVEAGLLQPFPLSELGLVAWNVHSPRDEGDEERQQQVSDDRRPYLLQISF